MTLKRITLFILLLSSVAMAADVTMSAPALNMAGLLEKAFMNLCGQFAKMWPYSIAIALLYVAMRYIRNLIPVGNDATGKKPVNTNRNKSKQTRKPRREKNKNQNWNAYGFEIKDTRKKYWREVRVNPHIKWK